MSDRTTEAASPTLPPDFPKRADRHKRHRSDSAPQASSPGPARDGKRPHRLIPLLFVLAGVLVVLYPVLATQYNNFRQHQFAVQYNSDIADVPADQLAAGLEAARAYNSTISGIPILDPYLEELQQPESEEYSRYLDQLAIDDVMARIRVPSAHIDLPVRHGTSEASIRNGAGHLYGTSLPVGGEGTHAVLTSHTGMSNATLFDHLIDVEEGDLVFVDVYGETLAYRVDQIKVVLPDEIGDLVPVAGHDYLTLFTCTPYAVNSHRLLVRGERVPWTPEVDAAYRASDSWIPSLSGWMIGLLALALIGTVGVVALVIRERRRAPRPRIDEGGAVADSARPASTHRAR